jgi:glycosyltransferase involved in cell wall biosynthesis
MDKDQATYTFRCSPEAGGKRIVKRDLVSCIVPVFNGERYLSEALDSILKQSYKPLEIIVVDDGSRDGTREVVQRYGTRVRYLHQSNAGPGVARNLGLGAATGEFVAFLDADDLWNTEKLERQIACFRARPDLEVCLTHVQNFWIPELREEETRLRLERLAQPLPGYVPQTVLARRAVFEKVGPFNGALRHGEDTDWFLRAAEQGTVMEMLPEVFVRRRIHHHNMTRIEALSSQNTLVGVIKESLNRRRNAAGTGPVPLSFPTSRDNKKA